MEGLIQPEISGDESSCINAAAKAKAASSLGDTILPGDKSWDEDDNNNGDVSANEVKFNSKRRGSSRSNNDKAFAVVEEDVDAAAFVIVELYASFAGEEKGKVLRFLLSPNKQETIY
mmetsp:Transcript_20816/g.29686  ORF Transcript_20816/g.29686 Transcript_20816/m.29686 type:complete len:117 (+) Transcript_20816:1373-1723(+)